MKDMHLHIMKIQTWPLRSKKEAIKWFYQPASVVVHFEGISNGTDTAVSNNVKQYQETNRDKFLHKWNEELVAKHFPAGNDVYWARDLSKNKKTILVIDHYVPQFDKDAGSRTLFQYIQLFCKMGYNVKFLGDNFFRDEPYTAMLQQMGCGGSVWRLVCKKL